MRAKPRAGTLAGLAFLALAACGSRLERAPATAAEAPSPTTAPGGDPGTTAAPRAAPPYTDGAFANPGFDAGFGDLLRFFFTREPGEWRRDLAEPPGPPAPASVGTGALRVTLVGHATALLQYDGLNVLTDPIWSERASPVGWAGPRRYRPPMLAFETLPRIHAVLISHDHYDHLDLPTLQRLAAAHDPLFLVGLNQGALLREAGITRIAELDWQGSVALGPAGLRAFGAEARHWTGRGAGQRNRSLWMSWVLETHGGPVYFAGDTGYGPQFAAARVRFGPMRLALLPIGAYKPRWITAFQHMDPCEAVRAAGELGAQRAVAIHHGTFELADDGQHEPPAELARCIAAAGPPGVAFTAPAFGQGLDVLSLPRGPQEQ